MLVDIKAVCFFAPKDERLAHQLSKKLRSYGILILPHDYAFGTENFPDIYFKEIPNALYIVISSKGCERSHGFVSLVKRLVEKDKPIFNITLDNNILGDIINSSKAIPKLRYADSIIPYLAKTLNGEISIEELSKTPVESFPEEALPSTTEPIPPEEDSSVITTDASAEVLQESKEELIEDVNPIKEKVTEQPEPPVAEEEPLTSPIAGPSTSPSEKEKDSYPSADGYTDIPFPESAYVDYNEEPKKSKIIWWVIIGVVIIACSAFAYWKLVYSPAHAPKAAENEYAQIDEEIEEPIEEIEETFEEEYIDSTEAEGENMLEEEYNSEDAVANYPDASWLTSAEAYDVYESVITDESMGDNWRSTNVVSNAVSNKSVKQWLSATGNIKGNDIRFEAVLLKNGRIYGRYNHSNGTKLDINGVEDGSGNLIIKLGHGSATSYWVLNPYGTDDGTSVYYSGTWGRKDSDTEIQCKYSPEQ